MLILGLNAWHGDASAAIVRDGRLVAAIEEERLSRVKHAAGFPELAVRACLDEAGASLADVDHVAVSRDPSMRLMKKVLHVVKRGPRIAQAVRDRLQHAGRQRGVAEILCERLGVAREDVSFRLHRVEHHRCHVASAFLVSEFEEAACASIDGFGDFVSTMRATGRGTSIDVLDRVDFPHSLGILYTMITQFIGFRKYGDEGKVMGLAPYGTPRHRDAIAEMCRPEAGGLFSLDTSWFRHAREGVEMAWDEGSPAVGLLYSERMIERFGAPREPGTELTERDRDLAASLQAVLEDRVLELLAGLHEQVPSENLALAGGVALNCVANGKIRQRTPFRNLYVQAASGDSGTAIGAAYSVWNEVLGQPRGPVMESACTGPHFDGDAIDRALAGTGLAVERVQGDELYSRAAEAIASGRVVGWFQGRMEFGPRALGNRSIVADPRRPDMKDILNRRVKHREPFRPFAPSVQAERVAEYFEQDHPSPFMNLCYAFREEWREKLPAVDHVDHTGRLQTVDRRTNEPYWSLIEAFRKRTGVALVLNTSFNENEPIVCTPEDAIRCFTSTEMDLLVLGDRFVTKPHGHGEQQ